MATTPKDVRAGELDATDRELLRLLQSDARMPNSELAQRVGIAAHAGEGELYRAPVMRRERRPGPVRPGIRPAR